METSTAISKPPIGLRPRKYAEEERLQEVKRAIFEYMEADLPIPSSWLDEYNDLIERLKLQ